MRFADAKGLKPSRVSAMCCATPCPSIVTILGVLYGTLVGSVVLVEVVFAWGGAGQYAVSAVLNADINASLGFILMAAVVSLLVHLIVDFITVALDPRTRTQ